MKSFIAENPGHAREWLLVNADGKPLGRLAVGIAAALRGKTKPSYTPHVDMGAFVVVINAEKVKLTGKKETQKLYETFSGFRDGLKRVPASEVRRRHPDRMIKIAVHGMLPKNQLSRRVFRRLKVYAGPDHPHAAQNLREVAVA